MPTLAQYRQEIHVRSRQKTGRTLAIASLTGTTVVCNALATGTVTAGKFTNKWLLRPDAAPASPGADRVRLTTDTGFSSTTGTLTHAGTAYNDTTATTENVEVCEYEPYLYDNAIDMTLRSLNRSDRFEMPARQGATRYWLHDLTWIAQPRDIQKVCIKHTPVLSRNRFFEQWNGVSTAGVPTADGWTISGGTSTYARSTTQVRTGQYSAAITRTGADAFLTQTVGLLSTGVLSLIGRTVQVVGGGWSAAASQLRFWVSFDGGTTRTYTSYHTGGSGFEELVSAETTVPTTAANVTFGAADVTSATVCYVDDCYLVFGPVNDSVRRDDYPEAEIGKDFDQGAGTMALLTEPYAYGSQLVIYSLRPYPGLDATRLVAGTADADVSDAPLETVALGALWRLYDGLAQDDPQLAPTAQRWRMEYEALAVPHVEDKGDGRAGAPIPPMVGMMARRF